MLVEAPWSAAWDQLSSSQSTDALRLSLATSLATTALALIVGVPLAWILALGRFPGRALLRAVVIVPLVLPPVAGGIALLLAFGRRGLVGGLPQPPAPRHAGGGRVGTSLRGHAFSGGDRRVWRCRARRALRSVASTLGAGRWQRFWRVTVPILAPSVRPAPRSPGRGRSGSSARRSPSPEICPVEHRPFHWRSSSSATPIPRTPSCCRSCSSPSRPPPSSL